MRRVLRLPRARCCGTPTCRACGPGPRSASTGRCARAAVLSTESCAQLPGSPTSRWSSSSAAGSSTSTSCSEPTGRAGPSEPPPPWLDAECSTRRRRRGRRPRRGVAVPPTSRVRHCAGPAGAPRSTSGSLVAGDARRRRRPSPPTWPSTPPRRRTGRRGWPTGSARGPSSSASALRAPPRAPGAHGLGARVAGATSRHLRLRDHAHTLGYGGQFSSKSVRFSTTFAALRQARADYVRRDGRRGRLRLRRRVALRRTGLWPPRGRHPWPRRCSRPGSRSRARFPRVPDRVPGKVPKRHDQGERRQENSWLGSDSGNAFAERFREPALARWRHEPTITPSVALPSTWPAGGAIRESARLAARIAALAPRRGGPSRPRRAAGPARRRRTTAPSWSKSAWPKSHRAIRWPRWRCCPCCDGDLEVVRDRLVHSGRVSPLEAEADALAAAWEVVTRRPPPGRWERSDAIWNLARRVSRSAPGIARRHRAAVRGLRPRRRRRRRGRGALARSRRPPSCAAAVAAGVLSPRPGRRSIASTRIEGRGAQRGGPVARSPLRGGAEGTPAGRSGAAHLRSLAMTRGSVVTERAARCAPRRRRRGGTGLGQPALEARGALPGRGRRGRPAPRARTRRGSRGRPARTASSAAAGRRPP